MIDDTTKQWTRNAADEHASENGYRFDNQRGQFVINFVEDNLRLYEGDFAGHKIELLDWHWEVLMRCFGWVKFSEDWGRDIRRFRVASIWAPKKNAKSPLAAMVGLYLLVADGEQGQKVFSAAKDGQQAKIVHTHAEMMVRQSEELSGECKINKSTGRIYHSPTMSFYDRLAGDNIQGQEGLNGSVVIDETHVVDQRLADTLEFMGASRSEPLQFEVSTAGDNPESYGKKQWDYGQSVNAGEIIDDHFLFVSYAAPQDTTDEECGSMRVWKAANPSWGKTIKESEFRQAHEKARRSPSSFAKFKKYRLNIWQSGTNPWLKKEFWVSCKQSYTAADMEGADCWAGLDLSRTRDMTSLSLVFPWGENSVRVLPFFWMPEERARSNSHLASFMEWEKNGHLSLIPGDVMSFETVGEKFVELAERFCIQQLIFDQTYAEDVTQRMEDETGVDRIAFKQTAMQFAGPVAEAERLVLSGKLHHNSHPVLSWQFGHAHVAEDSNNNKRPVKPKRGDIKTIDGVVATVMGLWGWMSGGGGFDESGYDGEPTLSESEPDKVVSNGDSAGVITAGML